MDLEKRQKIGGGIAEKAKLSCEKNIMRKTIRRSPIMNMI